MSDRLAELRVKPDLTNDELSELIRLSPPGTFVTLPNFEDMGVVDLRRAFKNLQEGTERSRYAFEVGCYIEAIALTIQHAEFWLRMFVAGLSHDKEIFRQNNKKSFGMVVMECKRLGMDRTLVTELLEFNRKRVSSVHQYLLGVTDYDDLLSACRQYLGLDRKVQQYVVAAIGEPATGAEDITGRLLFRQDL
ncbi:hypothetical protein GMSM_00910 [Geomonas sp. Red276]